MSQNLALRTLNRNCKHARSWASVQQTQSTRVLSLHSRSRNFSASSIEGVRPQNLYSKSSLPTFRQLHTSLNLRQPESSSTTPTAAPLTIEAYHEHADSYLETLVNRLEDLGETKLDLDVEFSAGVLNCVFPPNGTYVLNKQPPNKQIWLSSPVSGPKRYDYVLQPGMPEAAGEWVYLRDGSKLSDLIREELGVEVVESAEES